MYIKAKILCIHVQQDIVSMYKCTGRLRYFVHVHRKAQRKILTLEKDVEQAKCSEYTVDHYLTKVISAVSVCPPT